MYQFHDTVSGAVQTNAPVDNMMINGKSLDQSIHGYQQLYVGGRDLLGQVVDTTDVPLKHGTWVNYVYDEPRVIEVYFKLKAKSSNDLRLKYSELNKLLRQGGSEGFEIRFADDPDYSYQAVYMQSNIKPEQSLTVLGSFELLCPYPYKVSGLKSVLGATVPQIEGVDVSPYAITVVVNKDSNRVEILNGKARIVLNGFYESGKTIFIDFSGDDVDVIYQGRNILSELEWHSNLEDVVLNSGDTLTGVNVDIMEIAWRDEQL